MKVWARGGLGNQILEYAFGISYAIKKNKTFSLHFSTKPPKKSDFVFHNQSLPLIQNLFYLDRKINLSDKKKIWDNHPCRIKDNGISICKFCNKPSPSGEIERWGKCTFCWRANI